MSRRSTPASEVRSSRQKPTERAFVIHFEPIGAARSRLRGRVEQVASGEVAQFRSTKQLVGFMVGALQRILTDQRTIDQAPPTGGRQGDESCARRFPLE